MSRDDHEAVMTAESERVLAMLIEATEQLDQLVVDLHAEVDRRRNEGTT